MIPETPEAGLVLAIGSAGMDIVGRPRHELERGTSNPGSVRVSEGGVARNVAENLARLGHPVALVSAVGDDRSGRRILDQAREAGINVDHVLVVPDQPTSYYLALLDNEGNLHLGLDDMRVLEALTPEFIRSQEGLFAQAQAVFVDANLNPKSLEAVFRLARRNKLPVAADPTSTSLAARLAPHLSDLWLVTPNEAEANVLCPQHVEHADTHGVVEAARHLVASGVRHAIITMAEFGLGYATAASSGHVPALKTEIQDPTGAGDALTAAVMFALLQDIPIDEAVRLGLAAASLTLRSPGTVAEDLSLELLYDQLM